MLLAHLAGGGSEPTSSCAKVQTCGMSGFRMFGGLGVFRAYGIVTVRIVGVVIFC